GGAQPRGTRAHNHHVAHRVEIHRLVETKTVGDLLVSRIPEHDLPAIEHHRHVAWSDPILIEERLHAVVAIEIDHLKRVAVAGEKLTNAKRSRAVRRAKENDVAVSALDEQHATENECAKQDRADLRVGLDEVQHRLPIELDDLAILSR